MYVICGTHNSHAAPARQAQPSPKEKPVRHVTRRDVIYLILQMVLVAGIDMADEFAHALFSWNNARSGLANATQLVDFEAAHDLWIEPGVQSFFTHSHHFLGAAISWPQARAVADAMYGQGHVLITFLFALWVYFFRRGLFAFVRNVFVLTNLLAVVLYEIFPLAPPRLATGLRFEGRPYHFLDAVFGNGGLKLGFNEFAAMPSLHVGWALIVGLTLTWAARPLLLRALGLIYPLIMLTTVIVTGNHYLLDGLGALAVVSFAAVCSVMVAWRGAGKQSLGLVLRRLHALRRPLVEEETTIRTAPRLIAA
jgi:hypothetical protein